MKVSLSQFNAELAAKPRERWSSGDFGAALHLEGGRTTTFLTEDFHKASIFVPDDGQWLVRFTAGKRDTRYGRAMVANFYVAMTGMVLDVGGDRAPGFRDHEDDLHLVGFKTLAKVARYQVWFDPQAPGDLAPLAQVTKIGEEHGLVPEKPSAGDRFRYKVPGRGPLDNPDQARLGVPVAGLGVVPGSGDTDLATGSLQAVERFLLCAEAEGSPIPHPLAGVRTCITGVDESVDRETGEIKWWAGHHRLDWIILGGVRFDWSVSPRVDVTEESLWAYFNAA